MHYLCICRRVAAEQVGARSAVSPVDVNDQGKNVCRDTPLRTNKEDDTRNRGRYCCLWHSISPQTTLCAHHGWNHRFGARAVRSVVPFLLFADFFLLKNASIHILVTRMFRLTIALSCLDGAVQIIGPFEVTHQQGRREW